MTADLKNEAQKALDAYDKYESHRDALQFAAAIESLRKAVELQAPAEAHGDERVAFEAWADRNCYYTKRSDKNPARYHAWLTNALWDGWNGRATSNVQPKQSAAYLTGDGKLHVTAWQCHGCGHRGIDDGDDAAEACSDCNWRGPCPDEDVCPGCGREGTMVSACPKCGDRYYIKAEADIVIPTAAQAPAVGAEPVRYPHPDEDDPVTLWKEIRRLRAAMSQAKCDCTAYCGQYVLHGSCRAHPAPVTISHVPVQGQP